MAACSTHCRPVPLIPRTIPAVGLKLPLQPRTVPAPGLQVLQHYRPAAIPGLHLRLQSRTASIMVAKKMENEKAWLCYLVAKGTRDIILSKDNINHGDGFCFFSLEKLLLIFDYFLILIYLPKRKRRMFLFLFASYY